MFNFHYIYIYLGCQQMCIPEYVCVLQSHTLKIAGLMGKIVLGERLLKTHATL